MRKEARKAIEPEYNHCPVECLNSPRYYDAARAKYCDSCPHKLEKDAFREEVETTLQETVGGRVKFGFDDCLPVFYSLLNVSDAAVNNLSVKRAQMLGVYLSEKNRAEEIEERERQASQPKS